MFKTINEVKLHYQVYGQGQPFFILHGWGAPQSAYQALIDHLAQTYQVFFVDLPGFGLSPEPEQPWDINDYTQLILNFIASFKFKHVSLLGHSFGGRLIAKLHTYHQLPFEINSIVLTASAGIKPRLTFFTKLKILLSKIVKFTLKLPIIKDMFQELNTFLFTKIASTDYQQASPIMRQTLKLAVNEDLSDAFRQITAPTLLIWGKNDIDTPLVDGRKIHQLINESQLAIITQAGHYPFLDQPTEFNKHLNQFLTDTRKK
jgi:alpha/beta superfamily hydrolase/acyltransferase